MKYTSGWKYRLEEMEVASVPEFHKALVAREDDSFVVLLRSSLVLKQGYAWNGASFILFRIFGTPDRWKVASAMHDGFYQLFREGKLPSSMRILADQVFYRMLMERMPFLRAPWYLALAKWMVYPFWWLQCIVAYYAVRIGGNYAMRHGAGIKEVA